MHHPSILCNLYTIFYRPMFAVRPTVELGHLYHVCEHYDLRLNKMLQRCDLADFTCQAIRMDPPGENEQSIQLEYWATHSLFVHTLYTCYAEHYPLELTPDDVRLIIAQGLSQHLKNQKYTGAKTCLTIPGEKHGIRIGDTNNDWQPVIREFSEQMQQALSEDIPIYQTKFSTTTDVQSTVAIVAQMDGMQNRFEYKVTMLCGIPWVHLHGTPEDWRKLRDAAAAMSKYGLDWWLEYLLPILDNLVRTSEQQEKQESAPDLVDFWNRVCCKDGGSGPIYVSGWVNFLYPYDREGKSRQSVFQTDMKTLISEFPNGISIAPIELVLLVPRCTFPMRLVGGFLGIYQNKETRALRPFMGWSMCRGKPQFPETKQDKENQFDGCNADTVTPTTQGGYRMCNIL